GPDGGRSKRSLEWRGHRSRCRCQQGKTECRPFLHGVGPNGVSATGRLQERHGQVSPRVEGLPEGGRPIANLHSRREELRKDEKVPEGRYSTESQGCCSDETSGNGNRRSLARLASMFRRLQSATIHRLPWPHNFTVF